ncbi:MAG: hypothetical protein SGPRY_006919 [Prymnesium sp.]
MACNGWPFRQFHGEGPMRRLSDLSLASSTERLEQPLSRATISFCGLRLPQSVMPVVESAEADARSNAALLSRGRSMLHGPERAETRVRLRARAVRAAALIHMVRKLQNPPLFHQCSVLDLLSPTDREHAAQLKEASEVVKELELWCGTTSRILSRVEMRQREVHKAHWLHRPNDPPPQWEPSDLQLISSRKLAAGLKGEGKIDRAGYAYMQALIAGALHPTLSEDAIVESAADDFIGDFEAVHARGMLTLAQFLTATGWGESVLELAFVWTAAMDIPGIVGFLDLLRQKARGGGERAT